MLEQHLTKDQFTLGQEVYVDRYENETRPRSIYPDNYFEVGYVAKIEDGLIKTTFGYPKIFGVSYILERKIGINLC